MIPTDRSAVITVNIESNRVTDVQYPVVNSDKMHEQVGGHLLRISDSGKNLCAVQIGPYDALVTHLTATLGIKRRLVENNRATLTFSKLRNLLVMLDQRGNYAFGGFGLVAQELGGAEALAQLEPHGLRRRVTRAGPGGACLLALALHAGLEALGA